MRISSVGWKSSEDLPSDKQRKDVMEELIQLAKSSIMALFPDDRNRAVDSLRVRLQDKSVANGGAVSLSMIFSKVAIAE